MLYSVCKNIQTCCCKWVRAGIRFGEMRGKVRREVCEMRHFLEIADQFQLQGRAVDAQPHGGGHINDTFLVKTDTGSQYILQRINTGIFKDVDALMNNILLVTDFLKK